MGDRNSSTVHSNGSHSRVAKGVGWEEAKAEFYQEAFHTQGSVASTNSDQNKTETDKNVGWETMLPSKRTANLGIAHILYYFSSLCYVICPSQIQEHGEKLHRGATLLVELWVDQQPPHLHVNMS